MTEQVRNNDLIWMSSLLLGFMKPIQTVTDELTQIEFTNLSKQLGLGLESIQIF